MARFDVGVFLRSFVVLAVLGLLASPTNSAAQSYTFGIPPFSSVGGGPDSINLSNLGVDYSVPIFSRAGRGSPFSLSTAIQGFNWGTGTNSSGAAQWFLTLAPPSVGNPVGFVFWSVASGYTCYHGDNKESYSIWTFSAYYDANGNSHSFNLQVSNASQFGCTGSGLLPASNSGVASDGSGVSMTATDYPSAVVTLRDGTVINPALTTLKGWESYAYWTTNSGTFTSTDSNGNKITAAETDGYLTSVTDTLGTSVVTGPGNQNSVSYTAPSGASVPFTFSTTRLNVQSDWGCPNVEEFPATPFNMLTTITLPDGSYYQITYEQTSLGSSNITGRIASVRLPTGATIFYTYTGGDTGKGIVCADGSTAGFNRATPDGTWKYLRSNIVTNGGPIILSSTTTVTDPQGNTTVVNFGGNFETQRQVYTGAATGTPLETIVTCYNGNTSNCATAQGAGYPVPTTETNVLRSLNGGLQSEVDTFYNSYGLVTNKNEYDFGATTPTRKTTITYDSTIGNGVVDRPSVVTVTDGSGNIKSQTTYTYDQDEVAGTLKASGASQLAGVTCTASSGKCRGNATTVTSYVNSGATLTKTFVHYDTGQVYKATDVNGAITQYTYGNCGNSLLTNVSLPLSLSQSSTWNCTGGVMTSSTDASGNTSYTNYTTDPHFWRPNSTQDQAGNITNLTYASLVQSEASLEINSSSYADVVTTLDALGRSSLSQTRQAVGSSYFDTSFQAYDTAGRPYKVSMPCQAGEGSGCSTPSTAATYDGLGRPLTVTDGGGGTTTYTYIKNDVLQAVGPTQTFQRQLEYDGLGRLTSVCEITSAPGSGSGPCNQKNPQTGLLTNYTYDALNNLLTVTQNAQTGAIGGSQTRTYGYDGLSRPTSENNPESGTTYYSYDSVSGINCTATSDGDLVQKQDANGNYACYHYDALHRMTDVGNSSQTAVNYCKRFRYDNTVGVLGSLPSGVTIGNTLGRLAEAETDTCASPITHSSIITDEWLSYDKDGRPTDVYESTPNSGGYYHTTASYWPNNQPETLGILNSSGGSVIPLQTYGVDGEGRTNAVTAASGQSPASAIAYSPSTTATALAGALTAITFGSSDSDAYQYDTNTGRMTQYSFNVNGPSAVGKLTWNANGTLQKLAITDPFNSQDNQTCSNTYDDLARLSGNNCGSVWAQTFSYDAFGNVSKSGSISWLPIYNSPANDNVTSNNQYQNGWNGASYDNNGDLLYDTFNTYTWDVYGDLASANGVAVTYDAFGRMAENTNGAYQFVYSPAGGKQALAVMHGQGPAYVYVPLPGGAIAVYNNVSQLFQYNHADWLGSARLFSTPARTAIPAMSYAPFGEGYAGGQGWVQFTGINGWTVYDTENQSGSLEDFMFRRYSPVQGRWVSPDPAGLGAVNPANPQSWNRYAYVSNGPLNATDPLGLFNDAVSTIDDCVTLPDCKTYYVNGIQVSAATAGSLIAESYVNLGSTPYRGQIIGADNGIYSWQPNFYRYDCNGTFSNPTANCSNTFVGYGLMRTGTVAADSGYPIGPDPIKVQQSMRLLPLTTLTSLARFVATKGFCGHSAGDAVLIGMQDAAIKGVYVGATGGFAGGEFFGGVGGVPGAILGGTVMGVFYAGAGVFSGGATAVACNSAGMYQ